VAAKHRRHVDAKAHVAWHAQLHQVISSSGMSLMHALIVITVRRRGDQT
jgi:hypothetical protein